MTPVRVEERQFKPDALGRLVKVGPVIVTRDGAPLYVIQQATPEWLEAWAAEMDEKGDMALEDYASLYDIALDPEAYRREFPEDALFTEPAS
ncbi:MAG: hypothetical protein KKC71_09350 [Chloroflexi bacterium]|nr:hypothetical protein [Chloroflexota bacterium]